MIQRPAMHRFPPPPRGTQVRAQFIDDDVLRIAIPRQGWRTGPLVITVDLEARVLSVFRDGYEIGATAVLLGTDEHPTPLGTFPILSKERHNVSEIYGNAPMPWTLRLTGDGVAIHGGHAVELGWASHGCIGAPNPFMTKLFAIARVGDKAIITRGKRAGVGDALIET